MNLLRCHIRGFGKFLNQRLEFRPGLNVCFGPNEAGKSTLLKLLAGVLDVQHLERGRARVLEDSRS